MATKVLWQNDKTASYLEQVHVPDSLEVRVVREDSGDAEAEALRDWPDVLVKGNPTEEQLSGANLRAVIVPWAGVAGSLRERAKAKPHITVHNSHYNSHMVAHHAVALLMACSYRLIPADRAMRRGDWGSDGAADSLGVFLAGKVALLLGYGSIGTAMRPLLEALGMEVRAYRRRPDAAANIAQYTDGELHRALAEADAVMVSLPNTPGTLGLVGEAELAALKPTAVLVNVGRGPVIDEGALYSALAAKRFRAAGIDVWYRYPEAGKRNGHQTYPSQYPFHELDNVVMSPHRANDVLDWPLVAAKDVLLTLEAMAAGQVRNLVDLEQGY